MSHYCDNKNCPFSREQVCLRTFTEHKECIITETRQCINDIIKESQKLAKLDEEKEIQRLKNHSVEG